MVEPLHPLIKASDMQSFEGVPGASSRFIPLDELGLGVTIGLSTYSPGVGAKEHRHPERQVFVVYEGRGVYTVDGVDVIAERETSLLCRPTRSTTSEPTAMRRSATSASSKPPRPYTDRGHAACNCRAPISGDRGHPQTVEPECQYLVLTIAEVLPWVHRVARLRLVI